MLVHPLDKDFEINLSKSNTVKNELHLIKGKNIIVFDVQKKFKIKKVPSKTAILQSPV